jgi:pimeloyl-ACP methyl ester carboxylesterase
MTFPISSFLILPSGVGINHLEAFPATKYDSAGHAPIVLLLHGHPTSSAQFNNLIPLLTAVGYHIVAPDLPAYGFTTVPENYTYTFDNLASTVSSFLTAKKITEVAATYIFDYGAPVGFRLFTKYGLKTGAIISQNGNAYVEGLGAFWDPLKDFWITNDPSTREKLRSAILSFEGTKMQYATGESEERVAQINPAATYERDYDLTIRPGFEDKLLDLLYDYRTNVDLYPEWQAWMRKTKVPLLAIWGKNDPIFIPPGAEAFTRDLPDAVVKLLDGGHFSSVTHAEEIAEEIDTFLKEGL